MLGQPLRHNFIKNDVKQSFIAVLFMFFAVLSTMSPSLAYAEDRVDAATKEAATSTIDIPEVETTPSINTTLIAEVDSSIIVKLDGETLDSTEVHRSDDGNLYVNAIPIFQSLGNDFEFDAETKALIVRRSQDGVVMELYTDTGIVKADGRPLGKLKHFGEVSDGRYLLTPNAIAVLSGATGRFNEAENVFVFKLDPRLRVATGFEIFVNDKALGQLNPAPKSVGPVLLLPLLPIAQELGHDVQVIENGQVVKVRRAQDSAVLSLNLETGLVKIRDNPIGLSKDIAYIDPVNLLLPVSAIETLTGTHVDVTGGSNRVEITLDERLSGAIAPIASVDEITKNTPFTPESLSFTLGPDTLNTIELKAHGGQFNSRLRYEMPDLPTNSAELQPSWLSVDFAHTKGVTGSVGDYAADYRELDGVGARRIRGVAAQKVTDNGRWALAAGVPVDGAKTISKDQSRPTFGGLAAGVRYADREGWEAGFSVKKDSLSDDQMAVLQAISGKLGRVKDKKLQWDTELSAGIFDGPAREDSFDVRSLARIRYDASQTVTLDTSVQYEGAEFLRSRLDVEDRQRDITDITDPDDVIEDEDTIPDTRQRGLDQLNVAASVRFVPQGADNSFIKAPAASLRVSQTKSGAFKNSDLGSTLSTYGGSVAGGLGQSGVSLSADATYYDLSYTDNRDGEKGRQYSARAYKQFEDFTVRGQYQNDKIVGKSTRQSASVSVSRRSFNVPLPKDGHISIAPSVSALWNGEDISGRGGVYANLDSGQIFGEKTNVSASFGMLQSLSSQSGRGNKTDKFLTLAIGRRVRLGNNMRVGLAYRNDLEGNQRVGLQLDGRFEFNEARKYRKTEDGRGVLKGRSFLDKNRDGIKQEDEPPIPRALVRVKGTRMALRTDNAGFFTIQNIKEGIYEVQVDARSLPLGFDLSEDVSTRVTIADGQISDVPMPIVQRGQIRGFAFVDDNGNGQHDSGESRIEGAKLKLTQIEGEKEAVTFTTSFGQYAFDDLPSGKYEVEVIPSPKAKIKGGQSYTIDLAAQDNLMGRENIIIFNDEEIRVVEQIALEPTLDTTTDTKEPPGDGPAPP